MRWGLGALSQKSLPRLVSLKLPPQWLLFGGGPSWRSGFLGGTWRVELHRFINQNMIRAESLWPGSKEQSLHWSRAQGGFSLHNRPSVGRVSWEEYGPDGQRETQKPENRDPMLSAAENAVARGKLLSFFRKNPKKCQCFFVCFSQLS